MSPKSLLISLLLLAGVYNFAVADSEEAPLEGYVVIGKPPATCCSGYFHCNQYCKKKFGPNSAGVCYNFNGRCYDACICIRVPDPEVIALLNS